MGISLVQCRKALRVLLPALLIDMRSEKHALLIILHRRPFGLVTRPEKRGFHPKVLRYLLNERRHFLRHLAIEGGPPFLALPLQACLFLLQGLALLGLLPRLLRTPDLLKLGISVILPNRVEQEARLALDLAFWLMLQQVDFLPNVGLKITD